MIYAIIWAIWRRLYGEGELKSFWLSRGFLSFIGILLLIPCFTFGFNYPFNLISGLGFSLWVLFQFWSRAIGEVLDCGDSTTQNADSYDRWFRKPLDWIYDKLGLTKYTGFYDWWYMTLRYTLPMLPLCYFSPKYLICGLSSPFIYYGCKYLMEKGILPRTKSYWFDDYKNYAEVLHGFVFGLVVGVI